MGIWDQQTLSGKMSNFERIQKKCKSIVNDHLIVSKELFDDNFKKNRALVENSHKLP